MREFIKSKNNQQKKLKSSDDSNVKGTKNFFNLSETLRSDRRLRTNLIRQFFLLNFEIFGIAYAERWEDLN